MRWLLFLAALRAANNKAARIAMMAKTTSSSTRVKPFAALNLFFIPTLHYGVQTYPFDPICSLIPPGSIHHFCPGVDNTVPIRFQLFLLYSGRDASARRPYPCSRLNSYNQGREDAVRGFSLQGSGHAIAITGRSYRLKDLAAPETKKNCKTQETLDPPSAQGQTNSGQKTEPVGG